MNEENNNNTRVAAESRNKCVTLQVTKVTLEVTKSSPVRWFASCVECYPQYHLAPPSCCSRRQTGRGDATEASAVWSPV